MLESEFYQRLQESKEGQEYLDLIEKALQRSSTEGVVEIHHIFPKGLGGDAKGKCVTLTLQEHGRAHELLAKIFKGKMLYAYSLMTRVGERNEEMLLEARQKRGEYVKEHEVWKKGIQTKGKAWINVHTPAANEKRKETKIKRFGSEYGYLQTEEVKQKRKETLSSRYGSIMGACHTEEAERKQKEARRKTMIERYGSTTAQLRTEEVRQKANEAKKRYYEQRGTYATAHTHTPEVELKRKKTRQNVQKVKNSQEYSIWFEERKQNYYHKIDGVKDFLRERNIPIQDYLKEQGIL